MRALIVTESSFGNTAAIADAMADGLRAAGADVTVAKAPSAPPVTDVDLLLVGAPTHMLGLPNPASRANAHESGGAAPTAGVREWLSALPRIEGQRAVAFTTKVSSTFAGSAAKKISKALRRAGAEVVGAEAFTVTDKPGPLADGEADRARAWATTLIS